MSFCRAPDRFRTSSRRKERWENLYGSTSRSALTRTCRSSVHNTGRVRSSIWFPDTSTTYNFYITIIWLNIWNNICPVQCVSTRGSLNCVWQPPIKKTRRNWGRTSTETANRRRTFLDSRPSRTGKNMHMDVFGNESAWIWLIIIHVCVQTLVL